MKKQISDPHTCRVMAPAAMARRCSCNSVPISAVKVEKVVSPPRKPVMISSRHSGARPGMALNTPSESPMRNPPRKLAATVPSGIAGKMELYFQNTMYVIFKMMGFYIEVERTTSNGRIDVLIKTNNYIYILELKLDGSVNEALQQIDTKNYAAPFANDKRKLYKIGINFSSKIRGIEEWKIE